MRNALQITFRNMDASAAVEARVRELAAGLEHYCDEIISCRVVVETAHRHHHKGNLYHVRIDLTVPDAELVVSRNPAKNHAHEDVYVAVQDAFGSMRRQLEDYMRKRRGKVKRHEALPQGRVREIMPAADWAVIDGADGREVRFARNSVVDGDFDALAPGDEVSFVATESEGGLVATTVHVVRQRAASSDASAGD